MTTLSESFMEILEIVSRINQQIMHLLVFLKTSLVQQMVKTFPCVREKITSSFIFTITILANMKAHRLNMILFKIRMEIIRPVASTICGTPILPILKLLMGQNIVIPLT